MRKQILKKLVNLFKPTPHVPLGRWQLKHDPSQCEKYLTNNYADPGYPNYNKYIWIERFKTNTNDAIL